MKTAENVPLFFSLIESQLWMTLSSDFRRVNLHFSIEKSRNAISLDVAEKLFQLSIVMSGKDPAHPLSSLILRGQLQMIALRSHCSNVFLAGGDLKEIAQFSDQQGIVFLQHMRAFTEMLRSGPLVSVALLNGIAAGGGSEIALATDLRVSLSASAKIHFAQTHWGVPAGWGLMTDLRNKSLYGSERRRGIALAAQEQWDLESLERLQLIDARFESTNDPATSCENWLEKYSARLAACPLSLKSQLLSQRPLVPADKIDEYDRELFHQHWLGSEHRTRVASKLKSGSLKPKDE